MPLDFESCLKESDDCTVFFQTLLTRRLIQAKLSNDTSFAELLEKQLRDLEIPEETTTEPQEPSAS